MSLPPCRSLAKTNIATNMWSAPSPRDFCPTPTSLPPSDLHSRLRDLWPTTSLLLPCDLHLLLCDIQLTPKLLTPCDWLPNRIFDPNATYSLVHSWFSFVSRFCLEIAFVVNLSISLNFSPTLAVINFDLCLHLFFYSPCNLQLSPPLAVIKFDLRTLFLTPSVPWQPATYTNWTIIGREYLTFIPASSFLLTSYPSSSNSWRFGGYAELSFRQ